MDLMAALDRRAGIRCQSGFHSSNNSEWETAVSDILSSDDVSSFDVAWPKGKTLPPDALFQIVNRNAHLILDHVLTNRTADAPKVNLKAGKSTTPLHVCAANIAQERTIYHNYKSTSYGGEAFSGVHFASLETDTEGRPVPDAGDFVSTKTMQVLLNHGANPTLLDKGKFTALALFDNIRQSPLLMDLDIEKMRAITATQLQQLEETEIETKSKQKEMDESWSSALARVDARLAQLEEETRMKSNIEKQKIVDDAIVELTQALEKVRAGAWNATVEFIAKTHLQGNKAEVDAFLARDPALLALINSSLEENINNTGFPERLNLYKTGIEGYYTYNMKTCSEQKAEILRLNAESETKVIATLQRLDQIRQKCNDSLSSMERKTKQVNDCLNNARMMLVDGEKDWVASHPPKKKKKKVRLENGGPETKLEPVQ
jgi:hypothetical protein